MAELAYPAVPDEIGAVITAAICKLPWATCTSTSEAVIITSQQAWLIE